MNDIYQAPTAELFQQENSPKIFFGVKTSKFIFMSAVTLGLYNFYWFYKNFSFAKNYYDDDSIPLLRTFFSPIFSYPLFILINSEMENNNLKKRLPAGFLAFVYFLLNISGQLPIGFLALISLLTFIPLAAANNYIVAINESLSKNYTPDARYSAWTWLAIILGCILILLSVLGLYTEASVK